ncbi:OmpA family protein [Variovorax sp. OV329]|uniref:OmpA family protein n=1 Tax=Variovorax sp. OV329 TaxID=1882825 RepID=UPI0020C8B57F|nr:OmpA family protein [Variovorax sp. OV329]
MSGCSTPGTRVILLPQEDGSPSSVTVRTQGGEQLVSQPYQRATAPTGSKELPRLDQADPAEIRAKNKELFDLAPPKPQNFDLYFDAGGTALTAESVAALDGVVSAALKRAGADITVTGHTDTRGSTGDNDALSMRRAQEIKQLLVGKGFPADRVEAIGRGERELAVQTADNVDEPRNRRVVVVVR